MLGIRKTSVLSWRQELTEASRAQGINTAPCNCSNDLQHRVQLTSLKTSTCLVMLVVQPWGGFEFFMLSYVWALLSHDVKFYKNLVK